MRVSISLDDKELKYVLMRNCKRRPTQIGELDN